MPVRKKRRTTPEEEDLAAAVADMIQSPITRANLSFLAPMETTIVEPAIPRPSTAAVPAAVPTIEQKTQDETTTVVTTTDAAASVASRIPKVHLCRTVQEGHSPSEHAIYMMLWSIGAAAGNDARIVQVSLTRLAARVGMTIKNLQLMLRRLEEKKTIALAKQFSYATKAANAYYVYSQEAVLQRRKDAGLQYAIRNKGVQFIPVEEALALLKARQEEDDRLFQRATMV